MTWLAWRQFRLQAIAAAAVVVGLGSVLLLTGQGLADTYADGLAACGSDCQDFRDRFLDQHQGQLLVTTSLVLLVPGLVGLFWGAPLVARELETGTHRLVWNQSVTRSRWLVTKLVMVGAAAALLAALVVWAVDWWSAPIDAASAQQDLRLPWGLTFSARGLVPVAHAVFAFVLGVTIGMLTRRTLVAMALTLAVFATVQTVVGVAVRAHLAPVVTRVDVVTADNLAVLQLVGQDAMRIEVHTPVAGGWLLSSRTVDPSGNAVASVPVSPYTDPECQIDRGVDACLAEIAQLGYRQESRLHTPEQFWRLQATEAGLYAALSVLLAGFSFWWLRRRVT